MISLGASSDSLIMNADTDFGPRVSLELNSLLPSSLLRVNTADASLGSGYLLQDLIRELRVIVLLCKNMEKLSHGL